MKKTRFLALLIVVLLALVLVACGGEKPPVDTEPKVTLKPLLTTQPPVVTEPPVATKYSPEEYHALYVQDGLVVHLNFSEATENSAPLQGDPQCTAENASAQIRFRGSAESFLPYIVYTEVYGAVYGATTPITMPWYFEDYYKDGHITGGARATGLVEDMRTEEPDSYIRTEVKNGQTVYICKSRGYTTDYYYSDGNWARRIYVSTWEKGGLNIGEGGNLWFVSNALFNVVSKNSYTVELTLRVDGTHNDFYIGPRIAIYRGDSNMYAMNKIGADKLVNDQSFSSIQFTNAPIDAANHYVFSFDYAKKTTEKLIGTNVYTNGASMFSSDLRAADSIGDRWFVINGQTPTAIFSARVYRRALTAEEVLQNNFAEIALFAKLDIEGFLELDEDAKLEVYKAFEGYTIDTDAKLLQTILDGAVAK